MTNHFHITMLDEDGGGEDVACAAHEAEARAIDAEPYICTDDCTRCFVCEGTPTTENPMTICYYCGAQSFLVTCPNGKQHFATHHSEGACPRWYDVGGCFEDDYCSICNRQAWLDQPAAALVAAPASDDDLDDLPF